MVPIQIMRFESIRWLLRTCWSEHGYSKHDLECFQFFNYSIFKFSNFQVSIVHYFSFFSIFHFSFFLPFSKLFYLLFFLLFFYCFLLFLVFNCVLPWTSRKTILLYYYIIIISRNPCQYLASISDSSRVN